MLLASPFFLSRLRFCSRLAYCQFLAILHHQNYMSFFFLSLRRIHTRTYSIDTIILLFLGELSFLKRPFS